MPRLRMLVADVLVADVLVADVMFADVLVCGCFFFFFFFFVLADWDKVNSLTQSVNHLLEQARPHVFVLRGS